MTQFRPAVRENVGLLIGMIGGTGSGKTYSALRLSSGLSGKDPFAMIDTEARRGLHYADQFRFDHAELKPPFTPAAYEEAILAAVAAGYKTIMVDSFSHEHAGEGGLLDWHDAEVDRMAGQDYAKRERVNVAAWIKPKTAHKHMVQRLLQINAHLILCFRAEEKIEMVRENGKLVIVPKKTMTGINGWVPVCEKNLPFELTASFLLTADAPGYPKPIKLQEQHKTLFPLDKPITEESGAKIAAWAAGGQVKAPAATTAEPTPPTTDYISADAAIDIEDRLKAAGIDKKYFLEAANVKSLALLPARNAKGADAYKMALRWIEQNRVPA